MPYKSTFPSPSLKYAILAHATAQRAVAWAANAARHVAPEARSAIQEAQYEARRACIHARRAIRLAKRVKNLRDEWGVIAHYEKVSWAFAGAYYWAHEADKRVEKAITCDDKREELEREFRRSYYGGTKLSYICGLEHIEGCASEWLLLNYEQVAYMEDPGGELYLTHLDMKKNLLLAKAEAEAEARSYRRLGY